MPSRLQRAARRERLTSVMEVPVMVMVMVAHHGECINAPDRNGNLQSAVRTGANPRTASSPHRTLRTLRSILLDHGSVKFAPSPWVRSSSSTSRLEAQALGVEWRPVDGALAQEF